MLRFICGARPHGHSVGLTFSRRVIERFDIVEKGAENAPFIVTVDTKATVARTSRHI
jgi:hypothetical protein